MYVVWGQSFIHVLLYNLNPMIHDVQFYEFKHVKHLEGQLKHWFILRAI